MKSCIVLFSALSILLAQSVKEDPLTSRLSSSHPYLTDPEIYNSLNLAHSPLGTFENDSNRLTLQSGYLHRSWNDISQTGYNGNYLTVPSIRIGQPKVAFFEIAYGPEFLSSNHSSHVFSLTQHRFAVIMAGQTPSSLFQASLGCYGTMGKQTWGADGYNRIKLGLDKLRIDLGSQVHPLLRLGFHGGASAQIDTLTDPTDSHQDRFFQTDLPSYGGYADFGSDRIPVRSNLSLDFCSRRFVYVSKGIPPFMPNGNENAIIYDSLNFLWQTMARLPAGEYQIKPAFLFGWSKTAARMYTPHEENDPLKLGPEIDETSYNLSRLRFGLGINLETKQYAAIFTEYHLSSQSLECGQAFTQPRTPQRTLHSLNIGVSSDLHKIISLPLQITPRIGYFLHGSNRLNGAARYASTPFSLWDGKSQEWRYHPENLLEAFERTSGFTLGAEGTLLNQILSYDLHLAFLSRASNSDSGTEFGAEINFALPDKK